MILGISFGPIDNTLPMTMSNAGIGGGVALSGELAATRPNYYVAGDVSDPNLSYQGPTPTGWQDITGICISHKSGNAEQAWRFEENFLIRRAGWTINWEMKSDNLGDLSEVPPDLTWNGIVGQRCDYPTHFTTYLETYAKDHRQVAQKTMGSVVWGQLSCFGPEPSMISPAIELANALMSQPYVESSDLELWNRLKGERWVTTGADVWGPGASSKLVHEYQFTQMNDTVYEKGIFDNPQFPFGQRAIVDPRSDSVVNQRTYAGIFRHWLVMVGQQVKISDMRGVNGLIGTLVVPDVSEGAAFALGTVNRYENNLAKIRYGT